MKKFLIVGVVLALSGCSSVAEYAASQMSDANVCYKMGQMIKYQNWEAAEILRLESHKRQINTNFCVSYASKGANE